MSFDLSRKHFSSLDNYLGVIMQQGRVQTDADWNTLVDQFARRMQAESLDTFGPAVVPRETPDGFLVSGSVADFEIGAGRIYVDGILAENHTGVLKWDARLAEISGTARLSGADLDAAPSGSSGTTPYSGQPYYPNPPDLPSGENYLVYVDVWQRDITHLQDEGLVDVAVGVDTTARRQTVWQVKFLDGVGDIDPGTDDVDIPGWLETVHPSSARLSTATGNLTDDDNPCLLPPQAGYKGLENQLYRVQVHEGGAVGTATFKWSRDNAIVASRISAMPSGNEVVVDSLGRDEVLSFHEGDWVEITDDYRDLMGMPGEIRRIQLGGGIDTATRVITLEGAALPIGSADGEFPTDAANLTQPERHTRLIRWDQGGIVFREDETQHADLDDAGSTGLITVPPSGTRLFLEKGILVDFDLEAVVSEAGFDPEFKTGDYWIFAARVNDASIEILERSPPMGVHHHYAKLAIVDDGNIIDCRTLWPPEFGGESCACTVCVHPDAHNSGSATIQQAIDKVIAAGGGSVCLSVGQYDITRPLRISGNSVALRGQGWQSMLLARKPMTLIEIGGESVASDITVENLMGITSITSGARPVVAAENVFGLRVLDCLLANFAGERQWGTSRRKGTSQAIKFTGLAAMVNVEDCHFIAEQGVVGPNQDEEFLGTFDLAIRRCLMNCSQLGISFSGLCYHLNKLDLTHNFITKAEVAGIELTGVTARDAVAAVADNLLTDCADGIRAGISNLRILTNDVQADRQQKRGGDAIVFVDGLDPETLDRQQTIGNRISHYNGNAISVQTRVGKMMVKQNQVEEINGAGFVIDTGGSVEYLSLENNQFTGIDGVLFDEREQHAAIFVQASLRADILNNVLQRVVQSERTTKMRAAIAVLSSAEVAIRGNRLMSVTPANFAGLGAGIAIVSEVGSFEIEHNQVSRVPEQDEESDDRVVEAAWTPLLVRGSQPKIRADGDGGGAAPNIPADGFFAHAISENEFAPLTRLSRKTPVVRTKKKAVAIVATHLVNLGRSAVSDNNVTIRANRLDGTSGNRQCVMVTVSRYCGLIDNKLTSLHRGPMAILVGDHVAANHNRLLASSDDILLVRSNRYVVMGNMSRSGNIKVTENGTLVALPPPWEGLNVTL